MQRDQHLFPPAPAAADLSHSVRWPPIGPAGNFSSAAAIVSARIEIAGLLAGAGFLMSHELLLQFDVIRMVAATLVAAALGLACLLAAIK